jgi:thiol-disulfide isomerase/thioredoxin
MKSLFILTISLFFCQQNFAQKTDAQTLLLTKRFDQLLNVPFPLLELEKEDSSIFNTASLAGKTVYVDFWFTLCPPCIAEIPYARSLHQFFGTDTNIVFLNICIENIERKQAWKELLKNKQIGGINVFYARNRPQIVNLLRQLKINDFPTYIIVNKEMKIIGYNAPRPSNIGLIHFALQQAQKNFLLSDSFKKMRNSTMEYTEFINENKERINSLALFK